MPRRYCGSCRGDLHADDGHSKCVSCLGKSHADAALAGSDCFHCESISLASLRTRIAFFSESDPTPRALPFSSSQGPVRKKQRGRGSQRLVESELTPAQIPRASFSPHREISPVLFVQPDQRPSASVSDLVSFGGSDDELADDSMSLVASDAEELWGSVTDPALSGLPAPSAAKAGMDAELFRVLSKAVEELGLEWSPPEEPSRSRLDEWFLPALKKRDMRGCLNWMSQGEGGDPLEEPTVDGEGRGHGVGPHQESCHDRRLQHRLGGAVWRQTDLRPLVEDGERLPHQLLGNASSLSSLPVFPAGPNRTPCADSLRQHVRGVLYKSPGRCLLEAPLYSGRAPSGMGSAQPALAEGSTPAGQTEPRSRYVISEQCPLRGVDAPSAGGSEDLEDLWQGRSRPFRLQRQLSLPNLLFEGQGRVGPRLAQPPPLCIPPDRPASTGRQAYQGTGSQGAIGGPLVEEPTLVVRADSATDSSPLARAPETGSPLSGERNNMAPSTRAVGSLHLAAQWEPTGLPERVLNTISEARAPSTRRLYALKWSVFSTWCLNRGENPSISELAVILSFLQELLDKGRSHSTLKVFVAAIAAFHAPIAGQSVGRDNSVVRFLKGARRLNPPRPLTVPTWDLPTVLRALKGPPFEPLQSTDLRSLSLKTALLLALASVKRVGDLQALSTSPACLEFGPNDSKVVLKPRHGYVPKVLSTPFRAQVITLSALPPSEEDRELSLLCPVRALRIYFERSAPFRHTEQLFVSFGNRTKGHPVTKQRLSKWIVDAVMLAYSSLGLQCPIGVRAHSTRGIASSWAWSSGVSITEICTAAGWATPSTFARFYNLDIPALQARVLSA